MGRFAVKVVRLQLLLLLLLRGNVLYNGAAAAPSTYAGSFSPQETQNFWSSEGERNYTFGFKSVGTGNYILSIWHSKDANQTAIWWADFGDNHSSTVNEGATFYYNTSSAPILWLFDATSTLVWQCCGNSSGSSRTSLQFLDSGNLKVLQEHSTSVLWESFQDPRDSLMLVGVVINVLYNNPYLLRSRNDQTSYSRGRFHMATLNGTTQGQLFGVDALNNQYLYMNNIFLDISRGDLVGLHARGVNYVSTRPDLERASLDYDGDLGVYRWFSSNSTWVKVWSMLVYTDGWLVCRAQSPCGPFGICTVNEAGTVECSCPVGYEQISSDDPSKGCNSTRRPHGCGYTSGNDTSIMVQQPGTVHFFYNDLRYIHNVSSTGMCGSFCLKECACVGAIYLGSDCTLKANTSIGYLYNGLRTPSGESIFLVKLLQLPAAASEPSTVKKGKRTLAVVTIVSAVALAVGVGFLMRCARSGSNNVVLCWGQPDGKALNVGLVRFRYHELVQATENFSCLLGEGGSGKVYRGWLREKKGLQVLQGSTACTGRGMAVAVKLLKQRAARSGEDSQEKQFEAEVGTLSTIHHVNLVGLLGYCISGRKGEKRLLVYEYMEKGSLDRYLSPTYMKEPLPWGVRFSIAVGTARGIAYLHNDCKARIFHLDIKPQNVLLDLNFTPKVADFGLAEHFYQRDRSHLSMPGIRGTPGYMAPEWLKNKGITSKADVYSYGMLLLELVHGLNTTGSDHLSLIEWAFQCLAAESLLSDCYVEPATPGLVAADAVPPDEIVVPEGHTMAMQSHFDTLEGADQVRREQLHVLRVALWCVHQLPSQRLSMSHALQLIEGGGDIDNPPNPADAATYPNNTLCINGVSTTTTNHEVSDYSMLSGR